jgi:hypothetical protein
MNSIYLLWIFTSVTFLVLLAYAIELVMSTFSPLVVDNLEELRQLDLLVGDKND